LLTVGRAERGHGPEWRRNQRLSSLKERGLETKEAAGAVLNKLYIGKGRGASYSLLEKTGKECSRKEYQGNIAKTGFGAQRKKKAALHQRGAAGREGKGAWLGKKGGALGRRDISVEREV